jgi:transposase
MGLERRKVGQIPAKADVEKQEIFLSTELEPKIDEAKHNKCHLLFMDASHFVLSPFLGFLWCFTRLFIKAPAGRQRYNVLGAIDAISHKLITITNDKYINADSVILLFEKISFELNELPLFIVLDNVPYQRCEKVIRKAHELNIGLIFLPSYSPNLNIIERLWRFVKHECLYSKYYENFTDFKDAINSCLNETDGKYKTQLDTLLTLKFQKFDCVNFVP